VLQRAVALQATAILQLETVDLRVFWHWLLLSPSLLASLRKEFQSFFSVGEKGGRGSIMMEKFWFY
jgi:hypothetical protein